MRVVCLEGVGSVFVGGMGDVLEVWVSCRVKVLESKGMFEIQWLFGERLS